MRLLHLVFNRSEWSGGARFVCCRVIARGCVALLPGCCVALLPAHPVDLRVQGEDVVEYPGKVACPSGRRCSTRNAVWCHSHPGFKSQRYRHCRPAPMGPGGFVMPSWRAVWLCGPTGVPGAGGLGCGAGLLCVPVGGGPPASRPRCELRSARRLEARPGPAATHGHRSLAHQSLRCPPHQWGWVADVRLGASPRCPDRHCRRPRAPQPGPPVPPAPSTPVVSGR